jgi:hypothetical protein
MAYEIKNNEIAFAPAVENINRGFRVNGVSSEDSFKVQAFENMTLKIPTGGTAYINDDQFAWDDALVDNFESGIGTWLSAASTTLSSDTVNFYEGTKSLKATWVHNGTTQFANRFYKDFNTIDLKHRNKLIVYFRPNQAIQNDLYIKYKNNESEFTLTQLAAGSLPASTWTRIYVDLPTLDVQKNKFQKLIFEFDGLQWSAGTYIFNIDIVQFDTHQVIATADSSYERKDIICFYNTGKTAVVTGTPQSSQPVEPPDAPANSHVLAIVTVPAGATTLSGTNIFDTRIPNFFANNAVSTQNAIKGLQSTVTQLAINDLEIMAAVGIPQTVPYTNMVVEKFWDDDGLNETVEVYTTGARTSSYIDVVDLPRGTLTVTGLPDISGWSQWVTGGANAPYNYGSWKTLPYYWKGKLWTWLKRPDQWTNVGHGLATIDPVTGAVIQKDIWSSEWWDNPSDTSPDGAFPFHFYDENGNTWCAHPKDWAHDENYLYIPVFTSSQSLTGWASEVVIFCFDENMNRVKIINAEPINGYFRAWYGIQYIQYVPELQMWSVCVDGQRRHDNGHYYAYELYDKDWKMCQWSTNIQNTNFYWYGSGYMPANKTHYNVYWYATTGYNMRAWQGRSRKDAQGNWYHYAYTSVTRTTLSDTNGVIKGHDYVTITNGNDKMWMIGRQTDYAIRCCYFQNTYFDGWWKDYNVGNTPNERGVLIASSFEPLNTENIPFVSKACAKNSDTAFFNIGETIFKLVGSSSGVTLAGTFSGRRGVSLVGNTSIATWDAVNNNIYIADFSNVTTGREQTGVDVRTKFLNFTDMQGVYIKLFASGKGVTDFMSKAKIDVLDNSNVVVAGLGDLSPETYYAVPVGVQPLNGCKLRIKYTPDGLANIGVALEGYALYVDTAA